MPEFDGGASDQARCIVRAGGLREMQQSALVAFELRAGRAHQITGPTLAQPLEVLFAYDAAVKDPHSPSSAVLTLHGFEHLL
jgi:hypothetical protein